MYENQVVGPLQRHGGIVVPRFWKPMDETKEVELVNVRKINQCVYRSANLDRGSGPKGNFISENKKLLPWCNCFEYSTTGG